jgi:phospholipid transport system transporter-binding protein
MMNEFVLDTELTFDTVLPKRVELLSFIEDAPQTFIINFSHVSRSDSAGLALMIELLRTARQVKKNIVFKSISEQILSMMRFCDILPLFEKNLIK